MRELKVYIEIRGSELLAGTITGNDKADAVFTYDPEYLPLGAPISVSLPFQQAPFPPVVTSSFFEGLLPEGFSRKSVANWMHADEEDYLTILAGLGINFKSIIRRLWIIRFMKSCRLVR